MVQRPIDILAIAKSTAINTRIHHGSYKEHNSIQIGKTNKLLNKIKGKDRTDKL